MPQWINDMVNNYITTPADSQHIIFNINAQILTIKEKKHIENITINKYFIEPGHFGN